MASPFVIGADVQGVSPTALDSILGIARNASRALVPAIDRRIIIDSTAANVLDTLPDAATSAGVAFDVKRADDSDNIVKISAIGLDVINNGSPDFFLANQNEYVTFVSDGSTSWHVFNSRTFAIASLQLVGGDQTQNLTTGFVKLAVFDFNAFNSPGRVLADHTNDKMTVESILNADQDGYNSLFSATMQYSNNVDVEFAIFVDGSITSIGGGFTGKGATDIRVTIPGIFGVLALGGTPQDVDLRVKADTGGSNLTVRNNAGFTIDRLGG